MNSEIDTNTLAMGKNIQYINSMGTLNMVSTVSALERKMAFGRNSANMRITIVAKSVSRMSFGYSVSSIL